MTHTVLLALTPWLALLLAAAAGLRLVVRLDGARLRLDRLLHLHADEAGSSQSLSFVLTLPVFVMVIMLIVQISQVMIGTIVVHYAAFAAARSAIVWIPARVDMELENCISGYVPDPSIEDQVFPVLDPDSPGFGPTEGGVTYIVAPGSPKHDKISSAAVLACLPISPSRGLGLELAGTLRTLADDLARAYGALVPGANPTYTARRLENKLAWAARNTQTEIRFFHPNREPPLEMIYDKPTDRAEFRYPSEIGWQDGITVTVRHNMALLPGPGRLLAKRLTPPDGGPDRVSERIDQGDAGVYVVELRASAMLGNEGLKQVVPYAYSAW